MSSLSASGYMDTSTGGVNSYSSTGGLTSSPLPPSPHYGQLAPANDLSSLLMGQSQSHLVHHLGLPPHPSSPSTPDEYFMSEMHMPNRIKKKGRKPKALDGGPNPPQGNKRKSREGEFILMLRIMFANITFMPSVTYYSGPSITYTTPYRLYASCAFNYSLLPIFFTYCSLSSICILYLQLLPHLE